ncbi:MAG: hypothetical protein QOE80_2774 [Actinomycetota bacterium]|nr:hypothetical protein [Actinomycetota bacterium]
MNVAGPPPDDGPSLAPGDEARLAAQSLKEAAAGGGLPEDVALARLAEASTALLEGVARAVPDWAARAAGTLLSAWGAVGADRQREVVVAAREAGEQAARRVAAELAELFALDPGEQRATPLEIIRTAVVEPTAVLAGAGMPDVVRDPFEERAWPGDRFGLVPRTLRDLDPDLAAVHFAWGVAKAAVLRGRARAGPQG